VLYGTTANGGVKNYGTVYSLDPTDPQNPPSATIYSFGTHSDDGSGPIAGLTIIQDDATFSLYGTTNQSIAHGHGTFFQLTQAGGQWMVTTLYGFCRQPACSDGDIPSPGAPLLFDKIFYGTTTAGGGSTTNAGVLYRLSKP